MACNASKLPFIRAISARSFASAQPNPATCPKPAASLNSTLVNKIFVGALDNGAPVARVTIAYKAGSRYEPGDELGLTHFLRTAAGNSTAGATAFGIMRNLQQQGAILSTTVDRETVCYTLEATRDNLEKAIGYLNEIATKQVFNPWEFEGVVDRIKYDAGGLSPQVRAMDLLHKAAYRRGLGNSLFCSPRQAGKFSSESLQHFTASNFVADRCAVGIAGVSLDRAVALAQSLNLPASSNAPAVPSPYKGGELRKEMGGQLSHVAVGGAGAALSSPKEAIALAILARALSSGPLVKWGADNSPLAKAIGSQVSGEAFGVRAFSNSYSDDGLFGFIVSVSGDNAGKAVNAGVQVLKKASQIGSDAICRGRNQLITEVLSLGDSTYGMAEEIAIQGLLTGAVTKPADLVAQICSVSDSDVANAASKVTRAKLSMGAAGKLVNVPYVDELQ